MKKLLLIMWVSLFFSFWFAAERDLKGVNLITREQWGADETMRQDAHPWYEWWKTNTDAYDQWLASWWNSANEVFEQENEHREHYHDSNEWLLEFHPKDIDVQEYGLEKRGFSLDQVVQQEWGNELRWPLNYKDDKKSIVIHHTAWIAAANREEAEVVLQGLQVQHSFSRWWGDIGYHFLIDSEGNIYEWRAGWPGVIGAHTKWNNTRTIGIALMGDFEDAKPTQAMLNALTMLSTSLAWEYSIDPFAKQTLFKTSDASPYLFGVVQESIVWHKDASATSCPWIEIIDHIPVLKAQVSALLSYFKIRGEINFQEISLDPVRIVHYATGEETQIAIDLPWWTNLSCEIFHEWVDLTWCRSDWASIFVTLVRTQYHGSGSIPLIIESWDQLSVFTLILLWQEDLDQLLQHREDIHRQSYPLALQSRVQKITKPVPYENLQDHLSQDVSVMLYELSTGFSERDLSCLQWCTVRLDEETIVNVEQLDVLAFPDRLEVSVGAQVYETSEIQIINNGIVRINNYGRVWPTGQWFNEFRGDLRIQQESLRHLQQGWKQWRTVVNHVNFDDYIRWLFEVTDKNESELVKAVYLATKNYTAHYLDGSNVHPFVPVDASYRFVDDNRIMHQYVWYGIELSSNKRNEAIRSLSNTRITYENNIVLLPYYQCGPGYSRSGKEMFGRTDTPWLQNTLDVTSCANSSTFKGHGVWMSLQWAQAMARAGVKVEEIVKWWYEGADVN